MDPSSRPTRVAFVGDYVPRQCGIATFTHDLCEAVAGEFPKTNCLVGAVNDARHDQAHDDHSDQPSDDHDIPSTAPKCPLRTIGRTWADVETHSI